MASAAGEQKPSPGRVAIPAMTGDNKVETMGFTPGASGVRAGVVSIEKPMTEAVPALPLPSLTRLVSGIAGALEPGRTLL